jgi:hypothetical protein
MWKMLYRKTENYSLLNVKFAHAFSWSWTWLVASRCAVNTIYWVEHKIYIKKLNIFTNNIIDVLDGNLVFNSINCLVGDWSCISKHSESGSLLRRWLTKHHLLGPCDNIRGRLNGTQKPNWFHKFFPCRESRSSYPVRSLITIFTEPSEL